MPRNGSGSYSLPAGNPVEAGTVIEATWANTTLSDLGNEITNSLSRNGNGGMLAPFRLADGTMGAPGVAWTNEPSTGFYRAGAGEQWAIVSGQQVLQYTVNGVMVPTGKSLTINGTTARLPLPTGSTAQREVSPPTGLFRFNTDLNVAEVYNGTGWDTMQNTSVSTQTFSGDAVELNFTLASTPVSVGSLEVFISGVRQYPTTDYTYSGTTLTFVVAPPTGTDNILVRWLSALSTTTPADGSVTTAKIVDSAVTTAKIADANVTTAKLADNAVTTAKVLDANITTAKIADGAVTTAKWASANGQLAGMRNKIINGKMEIAQRGTSASADGDGVRAYAVDRFYVQRSLNTNTLTAAQSSVAPEGFRSSLLITANATTSSPGTTDYARLVHAIEGFNSADFGFGTTWAKQITLSFWVRSSITGTYGVAFTNNAGNRSYVASYTISAANTWEQKTITITADTTGTWTTDNSGGLFLQWDLGVGSTLSGTAGSWSASGVYGLTGGVKLVANSSATFYITGVQLEVGEVATPFEHRPYGAELALCQRYLPSITGAVNTQSGFGTMTSTTGAFIQFKYPVSVRTPATGISVSAASDWALWWSGSDLTATGVTFGTSTNDYGIANITVAGGATTNAGCALRSRSATAQILFTGCEL